MVDVDGIDALLRMSSQPTTSDTAVSNRHGNVTLYGSVKSKDGSCDYVNINDDATTELADTITTPTPLQNDGMISPPPQKHHHSLQKSSISSIFSCHTPPTVRTRYATPNAKSTNKKANIDHILLQQGLVRKMTTNSTTPSITTTATVPASPMNISMKRCTDIDNSKTLNYNTPTKTVDTPTRSSSSSSIASVRSPLAQPQSQQQSPPPARYKTIYFIRHGESLGQIATTHNRRHDPKLKDCGLSPLGIRQAQQQLRHDIHDVKPSIELVLCSPLTRAIQTAVLAFGHLGDDDDDDETATSTASRPITHNHVHHHDELQVGTIPNDTSIDAATSTATTGPPKILIHYHLREMGSNIPENQPRTMKQVCDYLVRVGTIRNKFEWDTLIDAEILLPPPPPLLSTLRSQYSQSSSSSSSLPSPIKMQYSVNDKDSASRRSRNMDHDNISAMNSSRWPYSCGTSSHMSSDTVPNVLRRDYIQYMLQWIARHRPEMNIAIVCHYHVIRAALLSPALQSCHDNYNDQSGSTKKKTKITPGKKILSSSLDVRPQNAQPIKCYLCTVTGQITLASLMDDDRVE